MNYYSFYVNNREYKLRLNTRNIVELEKEIGKNPIFIFSNKANNNTPTTEEMVLVLYHSAKALCDNFTKDDAYNLFDEWLAAGHICGEFTSVIVEVFKLSGIFKKAEATDEKN